MGDDVPTVLVVDDNPPALQLVKALLEGKSIEVLTASTKEEGLKVARRLLPELVIFDIDLPDGSGLDAARDLRSDEKTALIPLIALSGHPAAEMAASARDSGFLLYLEKPVNLKVLEKAVLAHLRNRASPEE